MVLVNCEGRRVCEICPYGVDGRCTKNEYDNYQQRDEYD